MVRSVDERQMKLWAVPIAGININTKSRDDIPRILGGLQYIYVTRNIREGIFNLLESRMLENVNMNTGRPGMALWKIFVLGVLRLDLNCDYDRLCELANNHKTIRQMLGHSDIFDNQSYNLQTLKDNVRLLKPELLEEINQIIVKAGHQLLSTKKRNEPLRGRCDSFVLETHVHFPTDIGLLYDAMRKVIQKVGALSSQNNLSDWRQYAFNIKQLKKLMRIIQKTKKSRAQGDDKKKLLEQKLREAHRDMMRKAGYFIERAKLTMANIKQIENLSSSAVLEMESIQVFIDHALRQIDQIDRRVLQGQAIPHDEKVFSIFQPHTEWISKGKAGKPVELGVRVGVIEDQHGFILHHRVMEKETDDQVAVPMIIATKAAFPGLHSCSFDKGYHSKNNQKELADILDGVAMRSKGKQSKKAKLLQDSESFKNAGHKHSAVESCINALEVHGLDKCYDHGIEGFKYYTSLAIVSRNIHIIGDMLHKKSKANLARKKNASARLLLAA